MTHPNEELLRKGYAAFDNGDLDTVRALFADDIIWNVPGKSPLSGTFKGKDEVFGWFSQLITLSEGTWKGVVHDVLANDDHAVVLSTDSAQRAGKTFSATSTAVYHIANGQVTEAWFPSTDQYAEDEFWA